MPKEWLITKIKGFSLIEALLASTVFAMIATAVIGGIVYGRAATAQSGDRARAIMLAEEGNEAMRNIRDAGFANLVDGTYGLAQSGNQWVTSGTSDISGMFTRQVVVSSVDSNRKNITSTVSWANGSVSRQTQVATRLSNWRAATIPPVSWSNASVAGSHVMNNNTTGRRVDSQGNYAYVVATSGTPNFFIYNISNPASPSLVGSLTVSVGAINVAVDGNYAYIASTNNNIEMQIINVTNPASPSISGSFNSSGSADGYGIRVNGNYVYLSRLTNAGVQEFQIINVTSKTAPTLAGSYSLAQNMRDLCLNGNYAYVVTDSDTQEVLVINVTNPAAPTLTTSINLTGTTNPTAVSCMNNTIYVGHGNVLRAVNVTTPATPVIAGTFTTTGSGIINDITVDSGQNLVFLATASTSAEFQVVNAANINSLVSFDTVDITGSFAISGLAFNSMLNVVPAVSTSTTQEFLVFKPN